MPFGDVPIESMRKPGGSGGGYVAYIKSLYYDPFKSQLVKSWVFFGVGIVVARELAAIDLTANAVPNL